MLNRLGLARVLRWRALAWGATLLALAQQVSAAVTPGETLAQIRKRGTLVVGVKTDYPPFGMLNAQGEPQGLEHDLASDLARRLGVKLQTVSVTGANRLQKLEEGSVDALIATTGDTAERRRIVTMVEPNYYASGVTLFMRPEARVSNWNELRGKKVCATQGSYFNRPMSQRYLLDLVMFNNARDARLAVRDGRCVGYLFDNTAIRADLARPEWAGYQAPLPPAMVAPWAVVLARRDKDSDLEQLVGDAIADWHRSGLLIEKEKQWGVPASRFLADAHDKWSRTSATGTLLCRRQPDGQWPAECRNPVFLSADDIGGLQGLGLWLRDWTGVNLTLIYDPYDRQRFLTGLLYTAALTVMCVLGSLLVGVLAALLAESRWRLLGGLTRMLAVYGRMTPPLLQMYLLFFGVGAWLWASYGITLPASAVAVWCLSFYTGSAVMAAMLESAAHERLHSPQYRLSPTSIRQIIGPSSGPVTAALVNVSKATMMASAISVPELLSSATAIMADTGNVSVMMNALLLAFLGLVALAFRLLARLERALREPGRARG